MMTPSDEQVSIAVIGGSGLYNMRELVDVRRVALDTPYGKPSADIVIGSLHGKRVAFLPRHGIGHVYTPTTIPYRANIYALKQLGVRFILAVNACGSLREDYAPGHIVLPDQVIDHTKADRGRTFFETGLVGHVSTADPFCRELNAIAAESVRRVGGTVHEGGTYITIEGPRFSTRAESALFRAWGCDIIGMTTCPEAFLAREAEIAFASMSHVTDYDSWHVSEAPVTVDQVIRIMHDNLGIAQRAIIDAVGTIDETAIWDCHHALDHALMTDSAVIPQQTITRLHPLLRRAMALS